MRKWLAGGLVNLFLAANLVAFVDGSAKAYAHADGKPVESLYAENLVVDAGSSARKAFGPVAGPYAEMTIGAVTQFAVSPGTVAGVLLGDAAAAASRPSAP